LDVAEGSVDRVNAWLDQVRIGGGYLAKAALSVGTGGVTGVQEITSVSGPVYDVALTGLFDMLETDRTSRVELRQQVQVLSGSETTFSSGEIVETPLIIREPETGKDLVSRLERRTVGLTMRLKGVWTGDAWHFRIELEDSNVVSQRERSNKLTTEKLMVPGAGMTLLASFTRKTDETVAKAVPVLGSLGRVGRKLFTKRQSDHASRSMMLVARSLPDTGTVPTVSKQAK